MTLALQIFILVNVLFVGVLVTIAVQHFMAHRRQRGNSVEPIINPHISPAIELPSEMKDRLLEASQAHFQSSLEYAADDLKKDFNATAVKLNQLLQRMGSEVMGSEMERYREELTEMRKNVEKTFNSTQSEVSQQQLQLIEQFKIKLAQEMAAEKQRLITQIDTKLGDAIASFLTEAMQHEVDLGAQGAYLNALLEEHKEELKQEVASDDPAAK